MARDYFAERVGTQAKGWPIWSDALGVHPSQIPEAMEDARKRGIPHPEFCPRTGRMKLDDRAYKAKVCRANGMRDLDGGYGDAT